MSLLRSALVACFVGSLSGVLAAACGHASDRPVAPAEFAAARATLIKGLRAHGIRDERLLAALAQVPRQEFVRPQDRARAYEDRALPIGRGQTISQPHVVALMTQRLELHGGERVLEVGTGSGYQAAILSVLARDVYSIEIDPILAATARARLQSLGYANVHVRTGDGFYGWPEAGPFDAIIVTAAAPKIPERLVSQLKPHGRLVMPLSSDGRQTLIVGRKQGDALKIEKVAGVLFVPMTGAVRNASPAPTP